MEFFIREASEEDLESLFHLSKESSLLSLPANKELIKEKIEKSIRSFKGEMENPRQKEYLFVCESVKDRSILGTSQIISRKGKKNSPSYSLKISGDELIFHEERKGPTEVGGLIIDPQIRGKGLGKLCSYIRFIYICAKGDFEEEIHAELSPILNKNSASDFWNHFGKETNLSYEEANRMSFEDMHFIKDLYKEKKILISKLPENVRQCLERVNKNSTPARYLLEKIGFERKGEVDPIDGGPFWSCSRKKICLKIQKRSIRWGVPEGDFKGVFGLFTKKGFFGGIIPFPSKEDYVVLPKKNDVLSDVINPQAFLIPLP